MILYYRWRFIKYYLTRVQGNLKVIDQLDLIGRTSEFARVFGIEFYHVLSRGSQVGVFCIVCIFSTVKFDILKTYISKLRYVEMSLKSHAL